MQFACMSRLGFRIWGSATQVMMMEASGCGIWRVAHASTCSTTPTQSRAWPWPRCLKPMNCCSVQVPCHCIMPKRSSGAVCCCVLLPSQAPVVLLFNRDQYCFALVRHTSLLLDSVPDVWLVENSNFCLLSCPVYNSTSMCHMWCPCATCGVHMPQQLLHALS